jgi:hypothetical protein
VIIPCRHVPDAGGSDTHGVYAAPTKVVVRKTGGKRMRSTPAQDENLGGPCPRRAQSRVSSVSGTDGVVLDEGGRFPVLVSRVG